MTRIINFNAGPSALPEEVLREAQAELLDFQGTGMSIMEHSHRGKAYDRVHHEALALVRELLALPPSHDVIFWQGGASMQFATVPMNFIRPGQSADYVLTGGWSEKAYEEAGRVAAASGSTVRVACTTKRGEIFDRIPPQSELDLDPRAAYVHITSNNTLYGTQWQTWPDTRGVPLVADMSSDILSKPIDAGRFALIYAGAQKNVGPSGVVLIVADKDFVARGREDIAAIFRYQTHLAHDSLYHTPPTWGIYLTGLVLRWTKAQGGLAAMARRNQHKAALLYGAIDGSFYRSPVAADSRSLMNVVFRLPTPALEERFVKEAEAAGMVGLKGHRTTGGIRASIYNAVSPAAVEALVAFMRAFAQKNG